MKTLQKKLGNLKARLPLSFKDFIALVKLPDDENCFEFSYFKTFINILGLFDKDGEAIVICGEKEKANYIKIMEQTFSLEAPENNDDKFNIKIVMFSTSDGYHRFAEIIYHEVVFYIDRTDGKQLVIPILA